MKRSFVMMMFLTLGLLFGCTASPNYRDSDYGLASVNNYDEFRQLVEASNTKDSNHFGLRGTAEFDMQEDAMMDDGDDTVSETNVQVAGIDEGDVIKTDGNRIYAIRHQRLVVVDVDGNALSVALDNALTDGYYSELYITDRYLVVMGARYDYGPYSGSDGDGMSDDRAELGFYWWGQVMTSIEIYDIDTLEITESYEISGNQLATRLIDDDLYIILTQSIYLSDDDDDIDPRPTFKSGDDDVSYPEYESIKYLPDTRHESFTIITHINLDETIGVNHDIFLGAHAWGQIYVSHQAIYFAKTHYEYTLLGNMRSRGEIISYLFESDGSVTFGGAGNYQGHVLNAFAMDEHDGYFRMVTTEGWGDDVVNRLYVFERIDHDNERKLEVVSLIDEGLGKPRETVRSVRFTGDTATVVTFEMTDPFYTIDLSNPEDPVITGELEITGFSTYQHPWDDDLTLGIGYEANAMGWTTGIKLALYDTSDPSNPVEAGTPLVMDNEQNGWQFGEALHNHRAILVMRNLDFIGFSINTATWHDRTYTMLSEYLIFSIDASRETPIEIDARISHFNHYLDEEASDNMSYYGIYDYSIDRAVVINTTLYVISGAAITAHDITDAFEETAVLIFNQSND